MDWKKLGSDAKVWADKAKVMADKTIETSKVYTEKAKVQSYDALVHSATTGLSTVEAYNDVKDFKRLAIFSIDQEQEITKKMLLLFPIVFTKAWVESGTVKVIEKKDTDDLRDTLEITKTPTVLVFEKGECIKRIEDEAEITDFMKNFTFYV